MEGNPSSIWRGTPPIKEGIYPIKEGNGGDPSI